MKKFFQNKTFYQDLHDLQTKIGEYDKVLVDFKSFESNEVIDLDFLEKLKPERIDWNSYFDPLELKGFSSIYKISDCLTYLSEEEIDRRIDSVGFARQLKRKRRALLDLQSELQKNKKKLLRILKRILKSVYKFNETHDYRQDLRQVLRKHMPLSIDEEESSSLAFPISFNSLNAIIELNNKIKSSNLWIKKRYLVSLNKYLNRKNYLLRTELH